MSRGGVAIGTKANRSFNEAERVDPRNANLLTQHVLSYIILRRFPEALRKLDQVLNITPDDIDTVALKAAVIQAGGDLAQASALLAPLRPAADNPFVLETQVYQAILERRPEEMIARLKAILAEPDPALGFYNGELRFWLGWAQQVAGDEAAARESWQQARSELEPFLKTQPENFALIQDLALIDMGLGDKVAALALAERAKAVNPTGRTPCMVLFQWRSSLEYPRVWGNPIAPLPSWKSCFRFHTAGLLSGPVQSRPRCSGWTQCLIRYEKTRVFRNWRTRSRESNDVSLPQTEFTRRYGRFQKLVAPPRQNKARRRVPNGTFIYGFRNRTPFHGSKFACILEGSFFKNV